MARLVDKLHKSGSSAMDTPVPHQFATWFIDQLILLGPLRSTLLVLFIIVLKMHLRNRALRAQLTK
jgi:hypothetical protein